MLQFQSVAVFQYCDSLDAHMLSPMDKRKSSGIEFMLFFTNSNDNNHSFWLGGYLEDKANLKDNKNWKWKSSPDGATLESYQ